MSAFIQRLNTIKANCTLDWLTPSQAQTWHELHHRLALGDVVNLHGTIGSGKTFLAWLLIKQCHAMYTPVYASIPTADSLNAKPLPVVDNFPFTREAYRELLKQLAYKGYSQAIVLSRIPIQDDCYRVQLALTESDLDYAHQRLLTIDPTLPPRRGGTLHHLINLDLPLNDEETL